MGRRIRRNHLVEERDGEVKKNIRNRFAAVLLILCSFFMCISGEIYYGASRYNNAKLFFESTGQIDGKHIEVVDGMVYFATKGGLASSSTMLLVQTIGHDVTLSGNGKSITFSVKRGGSLQEVPGSRVQDSSHIYNLYQIETKRLIGLAKSTGYQDVETVLSAQRIMVRMDAIMTTKQNGKLHGSVEENGSGGLNESGTIYHLKNSSHLAQIKQIFSGFNFECFKEIETPLENYQLTLMYNVGENVSLGNGYHTGTFTSGNTTVSNILYKNGSIVKPSYKLLQEFYLVDPGVNGANLYKEGYHLGDGNGNGVWKTSQGAEFSASELYHPKRIVPGVGTSNKTVVLHANWKPNDYSIVYNAAGGKGTVATTKATYDTYGQLRKNTFTKTGYYLPEGAEWIDEDGNTYANGMSFINWTAEQGGEITLYANWKPLVVMIDLDKQGGTGGTDAFWQKYGVGYYSEEECTNSILDISVPTRTGYTFKGYYSYVNGGLPLLIEQNGQIHVTNTFFTKSKTAYANWVANTYTITYDKQGGIFGTDSAIATYDEVFPSADAPVRNGYTFKGYFTERNGNGTCIYNENMASDLTFRYTKDLPLYAYWIDESAPEITLNVSHDTWTNQEVTLTAEAWDFGSGLSSVTIYRIDEDGNEQEVAAAEDLNGAQMKELSFVNTEEGIIRYKAVAADEKGNTSESYNVVYYDITAPTGTVIVTETEDGRFHFEIDITDINNGS